MEVNEENIRRVLLRDEIDRISDATRYWYIITYDVSKTDVIDIENVVQVAKENADYTLDDILERLADLEGIIDMESLDLYEVYY